MKTPHDPKHTFEKFIKQIETGLDFPVSSQIPSQTKNTDHIPEFHNILSNLHRRGEKME